MTRRTIQPAAQERAALQASRRMVARGERPTYRLRMAKDGRWIMSEAPWLAVVAQDRREALTVAASVIAAWLHSDPGAFDLAIDG